MIFQRKDIANDENLLLDRSYLFANVKMRHNMYIMYVTYVASSKSNAIGQLHRKASISFA